MRTSLSLRRHDQHPGGRGVRMLDLEVTPNIFAPRFLLEIKTLKSEPRALVTELSLHVGISKPASGGSGPHTGREVVTFHQAGV